MRIIYGFFPRHCESIGCTPNSASVNFGLMEVTTGDFIEDFFRLVAPMARLTRKEVRFTWDDTCEQPFQELKRRLTSTPILIVPKRGQRYTVHCDASKDELGCVLMQAGRVVAYGSRKLKNH